MDLDLSEKIVGTHLKIHDPKVDVESAFALNIAMTSGFNCFNPPVSDVAPERSTGETASGSQKTQSSRWGGVGEADPTGGMVRSTGLAVNE